MTRDFSRLAYAKLRLSFDRQLFITEYDQEILPRTTKICNGRSTVMNSQGINRAWGMVDPDQYLRTDMLVQIGGLDSRRIIPGEHPAWQMYQMMRLDTTGITDPRMIAQAGYGGSALRNATLDQQFTVKPECQHWQITQWIMQTLPFEKINSIHCVSIEANGFAAAHRDSIPLHGQNKNSLQANLLYKQGFVIININVSNGGVPLYWALDDNDFRDLHRADADVYLTNDYFYHGVPICTSRRRQIRVTGRPKPELWDLLEAETAISVPDDYQYRADIF